MAESQPSNVLPFGGRDHSATKAVAGDVSAILLTCRERLIQGVMAVFRQHLGRVNEDFLNLADRAINPGQQQTCFAAMRFLANRTPALLEQFQHIYRASFDASSAALTTPHPSLHIPDELKLIDTDEFEQDLALSKLTTRAACNCSQELVALDRRLMALLHIPRLSQDDNPLHPGTLFNAMLQALATLETERDLSLALLQAFERHTAAELPGLYADINRHLAQSGILPTIPQGAHQPLSENQASGQGGVINTGVTAEFASGASSEPFMPVPAGYPATAAQQVTGDVFSQLLHAIQAASSRFQPVSPPAGWPAVAIPPAPLMGQPASLMGASASQLIAALGDLQHGHVDPGVMPGFGSMCLAPESGNVLRQIRATPVAAQSHPMDAMTIDIVSMLFDAIFNDPDLSATMRAEIARLQIPVLKVALLDKAFFSDRQHPARHLLDVIANSGIGRSENDEPRLTEKIRAIVDAVVSGFDADIGIFSVQVSKLEEFLRDEENRANGKARHLVSQLEASDRRQLAAKRSVAEIESRLQGRSLPPLIADFLERHWRQVLSDAFQRSGDASPNWRDAIRLMDELIWSVEPKTSASERERLLALLPDLLKQLRQSLDLARLDDTWDALFNELIRLHMAALRNDAAPADSQVSHSTDSATTGVLNQGKIPDTRADAKSSPPQAIVSGMEPLFLSDAEDGWIAGKNPEASTESVRPDVSPLADRYLTLVAALDVGAWIEFQSVRGTRNTLRLNWISALKRVYLFTNRQGENAMTLASTSLADHLRKGTARLLSQNPLTDRAVAQVLEQITPPA